MKKHFLIAGIAALMLAACNNKPASELTLSGLDPAKFQTEVNNAQTALYTLKNKAGMEVCITNFGGRIVSIMVPDKNGKMQDVVLGFDSIGDVALDVIKKAKENGVNLVLGTDSICGDDFKNDCNTQVCPSNNIPDGWEGMDAGPETRKAFAAAIKGAKTILWNGPAGVFEFDNFAGGSKAIADAIAEATKEGAFSLIGGGDSVACINKFGLADQVSYISTGGGALLEAIEGKVLPGVAAIEK